MYLSSPSVQVVSVSVESSGLGQVPFSTLSPGGSSVSRILTVARATAAEAPSMLDSTTWNVSVCSSMASLKVCTGMIANVSPAAISTVARPER